MNFRSRGYRFGLALALLTLLMGATTPLCAQEVGPSSVKEDDSDKQDGTEPKGDSEPKPDSESESKDADDESADADSDKKGSGSSILDMDIEQLGKVQAKVATSFDTEVTSVTAHKSSVGKSAAAIFVITNEMIRRSGATAVPETLRMVPGLQVAKIGSDKWAISSRGFNGEFANKLLVLVDGRTVYSPLSAGTYWETQDLVLQDIDRIEVIRGPGATVWGANAVNGVINILTKTSGKTPGALVSSGGGNQDQLINSVRYGGELGDNAHYRVYARQFNRAEGFNPQGANDGWNQGRAGFRIDGATPDENDTFTLQGDIYAGMIGETGNLPGPVFPFYGTVAEKNHVGGANILGRWTKTVDDDNTWSLQAFFDRSERTDLDFDFGINTYDLEYRQFLKHSDTHLFTWGADYRLISDNLKGSRPMVSFTPQTQIWDQASLFGQDEMPFLRDDVRLTVGSKFLYYYYTGFEYQPSARLLWEIDDSQVLWGAVSRAVRTPSTGEERINLVAAIPPNPVWTSVRGGGRSLVSEQLLAYELGYRKQVNERLSFELATFYNIYRDLINVVQTGFIPGLPSIIPTQFQNGQDATSIGAELNGLWKVHEKWELRGWCSYLNVQSNGSGSIDYTNTSPRNQAYVMSSWDLPRKFELDLMARYVENIAGANVQLPSVPRYTNLDARLGWKPRANWEFSIIGQNLLAPHHLEFIGNTTIPSAVNRGVYAQVVWQH